MKKKERDYLVKFSMFLRAGAVDSGPPLSTILVILVWIQLGFVENLMNLVNNYLIIFLLKCI